MDLTRRDLLKAGVASAALAAVPRPLLAHVRGVPEPVPPITDPDVKELALKAVDAAKRAGAVYADVRLTYTRKRAFAALTGQSFNVTTNAYNPSRDNVPDQETLHVGVRSLVNGYWGFASGTLWSKEEMERLGREAVALAKVNAIGGKARTVELAPTPVVRDGHWETPMEIDPFEIPPFEVVDWLRSLGSFSDRVRSGMDGGSSSRLIWYTLDYRVQDQQQAFASTDGSFYTQRVQVGFPRMALSLPGFRPLDSDWMTTTGLGYEVVKKWGDRDAVEQLMEELFEYLLLPAQPIQIGLYDMVCDGPSAAALVTATLGVATQLDRALGYEANAAGTSYLNDPDAMVGSYQVGSPLLNLMANRSHKGGCATVQWDGEGVKPEDFLLVKDGVLADYQTTRESAAWLNARVTQPAGPRRAHGCAASTTGGEALIQAMPNLQLVPGKETQDFNSLIAGMSNGIAIQSVEVPRPSAFRLNDHPGMIDMDSQALNGFMMPDRIVRIKNGKKVARITNGAVMLRSPDLWKGLLAVGGEASVRDIGFRTLKGQPEQELFHTVSAPAAVFKQMKFINSSNVAHENRSLSIP